MLHEAISITLCTCKIFLSHNVQLFNRNKAAFFVNSKRISHSSKNLIRQIFLFCLLLTGCLQLNRFKYSERQNQLLQTLFSFIDAPHIYVTRCWGCHL